MTDYSYKHLKFQPMEIWGSLVISQSG